MMDYGEKWAQKARQRNRVPFSKMRYRFFDIINRKRPKTHGAFLRQSRINFINYYR